MRAYQNRTKPKLLRMAKVLFIHVYSVHHIPISLAWALIHRTEKNEERILPFYTYLPIVAYKQFHNSFSYTHIET